MLASKMKERESAMDTVVVEKKSRNQSPTALDRAIEDFARKLLAGEVQDSDRTEYERLLAARRTRLVRLPAVRSLSSLKGYRNAS